MELTEHSFYYDWEIELTQWLQARLGTVGTALASFFTMFGEELMIVAVLGLLYWCLDKRLGRKVGLAVLFGMTLNPMIKNVVLRPRPYCANPSVKCLRPVVSGADIYDLSVQGYSFPSGHATDTASIYTSIARGRRSGWLTALAVFIPLLCGISRVCLGVHYPTDVLCGWALGLFAVFFTSFLERVIKDERIFYCVLAALSLPGWFFCRSNDYYTCFGILAGYLLGLPFERKFVDFENTRSPFRCALRLIGGIAIFFGLNSLLKLPFDKDFLSSGTTAAYAVRAARYCIIIFTDMGVYPMLFKPVGRLLDRAGRKAPEIAGN